MGDSHGELHTEHADTKMKVILITGIVLAVAEAMPQGYAPVETYPDEPPVYTYTYGVADDYSQNNYGQTESRDGYNTQGEYYVNLPDGRLQKVTSTVSGDAGYVADVVYPGEAQHPPEPAGGYPGRR